MKRAGVVFFWAAVLSCGAGKAADAASVRWDDGDGNSNTIVSATWDDVQTAIHSATNGVSTRGFVMLSGDFQRASTNSVAGLVVPSGGGTVTISGGWDAEFVSQAWRTIWNGAHDIVQERACYSVLNVNGNSTYRYRVLDVRRDSSLVEGLKITGGYATDNTIPGGGIRVMGNDVRLSHLDVDGNACHTSGGGIYVGGDYGQSGYGQRAVVEYSTIRNNWQGYHGGWGGGVGVVGTGALVANCIFSGNSGLVTGDGGWANGSAIGVVDGCATKVFGCLFYDQTGARCAIGSAAKAVDFTMANCTVVSNANAGYRTASLDYSQMLELRNCVFAGNGAAGIHLANSNGGGTEGMYSGFLGSLVLGGNAPDIVTGSEPYYDEGLVRTNTEPAFLGKGLHPYVLSAGSPAVNTGSELRTMTEAEATNAFGLAAADCTIRYVNMDAVGYAGGTFVRNASYNAKTDVIVELRGYAPSAGDHLNHFIYPYDVAGNPRLRLGLIDCGAYEYKPPGGTVVFFR